MGNNQSSSAGGSVTKSSSTSSGLRSRSNTVDSTTQRVVVDGGFIEPQSLLYNHLDYSRPTVTKLIVDRKLSPFYLGLTDFEEDWDVEAIVDALVEGEQQATQNLKDALAAATESAADADAQQLNCPPGTRKHKEAVLAYNAALLHRERLAEVLKLREKRGGGGLQWTSKTEQAKLYLHKASECPICFLYYPPNMVHTRCCDQPLCTECFVQIKRAEPTPTHLESEPACCPFCMEPNFGAVYAKPAPPRPGVTTSSSAPAATSSTPAPSVVGSAPKPRRKSFAHTQKEVVTTDMVHPDWEARLEAMKATVARRANRRIVFRQVGDRLVPVGITSGRAGDGANPTMATTALPAGFLSQIAAALDASNEGTGTGRRRGSRRSSRGQSNEINQLLESLGLGGGADLEEMMLQEAMKASMADEEERVKKQKDEEAANKAKASANVEARPSNAIAAPRSPGTTQRLLSEAISDDSALSTSPYTPPSFSQSPLAVQAASSSANSGAPPQLAAVAPIPSPSLDLSSISLGPASSTIPAPAPAPSTSLSSAVAVPGASSSSASALAPSDVASSAASTTSSILPAPSPSAGYEPLPDETDPETASTSSGKHGMNGGVQTGRLVDF